MRRHLRLKFELGLFEEALVDESRADASYQTPSARQLARELARKSIVLLRNEAQILPLDLGVRHIAVIGPCADDERLLQGDYHYPAHAEITYLRRDDDAGGILPRSENATSIEPGPFFPPSVTPLEGIRATVSRDTKITSARGCEILGDDASGIPEAVEIARAADVAIVFVGGKSGLLPDCTSGEFRDASSLELTGLQQRLVEELVATGTPTIVVLINGRVFALPWILENIPGVLEAWIPGEEGGAAIADVLFGVVSPSGRLPVSLPRSAGQLPVHYSRRWDPEGAALFSPAYSDSPASALRCFGFGLSYTRFEYSELQIEDPVCDGRTPIGISFTLSNAGPRAGDEIVQLYLHDPVASMTRPRRQLAGFARVPLDPGESMRVRFELDACQLAFYDAEMSYVLEPGRVDVLIGAASDDIRLEGQLEIAASATPPSPRRSAGTRVTFGKPA